MNYSPTENKIKEKLSTIRLRKTSAKNRDSRNISTVILETEDKKFTFNLKNEKDFLDRNNISININKVRHSLNVPPNKINELERSIDNLNIEDKKEDELGMNQLDIIKVDAKSDKVHGGVNIQNSKGNTHIPNGLREEVFNINQVGNMSLDYKQELSIEMGKVREKDDYFKRNELVEETIELFQNKNVVKTEENCNENALEDSHINQPIIIPFSHDLNGRDTLAKIKTQEMPKESNKTESQNNQDTLNSRSNRPKIVVIQKGNNKIQVFTGESGDKAEEDVNESSEQSEFPYKVCFLCDQFFLKDKTYTAEDCDHFFCRRCGKAYYEEKIEEGEQTFKCAVYKCLEKISNELLKALVSEKHYCVIEGKEYKTEGNTTTNTMGVKMFKQKQSINNFVNVSKMDSIKFYTQKHVIDVNSNESFFIFNKAKEQFCVKCSEPALYGKNGKFVVKCLNCFYTICKFCMKNYTSDHFDMSSFNYCKVYFRKRLKKTSVKERQCCKNFWFTVLIYLASYILIFSSLLKVSSAYTKKILCISDRRSENCNFLKYLFYSVFILLIYSLLIPFLLFSIPYFPALITMLL